VVLELNEQKLDALVCERLGLEVGKADVTPWRELVNRVIHPQGEVEIAVVGKYIVLHDAYKSVYEALSHGGYDTNVRVKFRKIQAEDLTADNVAERLEGCDGLLVPGGFGERGFEGKIEAIRYAREKKLPFLGICLGLQAAVTEFARNVCGIEKAGSAEFGGDFVPVIDMMEAQKRVKNMGGTMRLGAFTCDLVEGTRTREVYGTESVEERHRHRYEINNEYRAQLEEAGLVVSGTNPDLDLVEAVELEDHPYFVAIQGHPEFQSKPMATHPLFRELIKVAWERKSRSQFEESPS